MSFKRLGLASAVMLATSSMAFAADDLQINGFINITAGAIDNKDIETSSAAPGYDTTVGYDSQTLAGLQISKKVNDNTSATLQLISRGSQGYETEAAWAYVTYELDSNTDIRFGRLRTPMFHYSDFLEVGYAYNWIAPPSIVYRLDSMSAITGVDITRRFTLGSADGAIQLYSGRYKDDFNLGGDSYEMELESTAGAVLTLNAGNFGTRLSYHRAELSVEITPDPNGARTLDKLAGLAGGLADDIQDVVPDGHQSQFYQGSVFWDNGSTSLIGEYTALRHDSHILNDDDAWFVSAAQRFGSVTAHLTYALAEDKLKSGRIGYAQHAAEAKDTSLTFGLRYDYSSSVAFKAEASYITMENRSDAIEAAGTDQPAMAAALNSPLEEKTGSLFTVGMSIVF